MTTERNLDHLSGANRKRDKHPARSARILTTGFSIAAVLGITTSYSVAAAKKAVEVKNPSEVSPANIELTTPTAMFIQTAYVAPAISSTVPTTEVTVPTSAVAGQTTQPVVKRQKIQLQVPVAPQPATTSSGSK